MIQQTAYNTAMVRDVIQLYERMNPTGPDSIYECMREAKHEQEELERSGIANIRTGVMNKNEAGRRLAFTMPSALYIMLRKKFPTIFKADKKRFERDFPVFFKAWHA